MSAGAFTDARGREVVLSVADVAGADLCGLAGMYAEFDPTHRAQGLPPTGETAVRDWLAGLAAGHHLVARHGGRTVGHAGVVPGGEGYELVIFVHQSYHGAGIGTRLLRALLDHAADEGVDRVWLTVERRNRPAVALYRKVGFEEDEGPAGPVLKMHRTLVG